MDASWPLPPTPVTLAADERRADPRVLGLLIGAAVPALVASVAWWVGVDVVAIIAAAGIPIGAMLGAVLGRQLAGDDWIGFAFLAGIVAPLVATVVIALVAIGGDVATSPADALGALLVGTFVVAIYAEGLGAPITVPTAIVAGLLVRRAARMPIRRAALHVGLLVLVACAAAGATLLAVVGGLASLGIERAVPWP